MANDKWMIDFKEALGAELNPAGLKEGEVPTDIQWEISQRVRTQVLATLEEHNLLTEDNAKRLRARVQSAGEELNPVKKS